MGIRLIRIRNAAIIGSIVAALEGILIGVADPDAGVFVLIQSMLFWFSCGAIVSIAEIGVPKFFSSILLTELMNLPWYITLVVIPENYQHLLPLVVASLLFGSIIGGLNVLFKTPNMEI
ncbi:hypothetical protein EHQ12_06160 [Leptospira gomenensis]|uniref:Uncharacterized protein n=1 Tax=Leptospira gomenensis TaxID=2484974 RepID=A0A5F1YBT4_9LEPT|nr:hypothetical protein [Leptospira gomenensis]TGK34866.1 hypothetical protein EHQ17_08110 [Leptospira gomenensis]TGK41114.1 hypothetical protein EHQ12_06160 [Leptospira gomenensis]TGK42083.1 hypothetical protein EHQ07_15010 [Leptospira gomenensis]TGK56345.1 hypothetical protein EHQ13_16080 [Leptospira gomenensis]